jgi:hypothetical protein
MSKISQWLDHTNKAISNAANVCFTLNNYTTKDIEFFDAYKCKYIIYGKEVGKDGTPHLQGYIELNKSIPKQTILNIHKRAHFEPRRTHTDDGQLIFNAAGKAREYCMKEGDFTERGEIKKQGKRNDLKLLCDDIGKGNITVEQILIDDPMAYHQHGRTLEKREEIMLARKFRTYETRTTGVWRCGESNTDKTKAACLGYTPDTHYMWSSVNAGWQCNYKGQPTVIINDFRGAIKYDELMNMVDWCPYFIPRRGRPDLPFVSREVIITSSLYPWDVYHNRDAKDSINQLLRRFDIYHHTHKSIELVSRAVDVVKCLTSGGSVKVVNDRVVLSIDPIRADVVRGSNTGHDLDLDPEVQKSVGDLSPLTTIHSPHYDGDFEDMTIKTNRQFS